MQDDEFARNNNTPLTDLNDPVIGQVLHFSSPVSSVSLILDMSSSGEGMPTPTSAMMVSRVSPPSMSALRPSSSAAPLSPSAQLVNPSTPSYITGHSNGVVTGIPSAPYTSSPFMHNAQIGMSGSTSFVQGFMWNGGHITPSTPYVGPSPAYVHVSFGN